MYDRQIPKVFIAFFIIKWYKFVEKVPEVQKKPSLRKLSSFLIIIVT